jgi:hypothetical protein
MPEENEKSSRTGWTVPNIRLDVKEAYSSPHGLPHPEFRLSFEKSNRNVSLYTATSSQSGPAGSVVLDNLTAEWIQSEFLKYQSRAF